MNIRFSGKRTARPVLYRGRPCRQPYSAVVYSAGPDFSVLADTCSATELLSASLDAVSAVKSPLSLASSTTNSLYSVSDASSACSFSQGSCYVEMICNFRNICNILKYLQFAETFPPIGRFYRPSRASVRPEIRFSAPFRTPEKRENRLVSAKNCI